MIHFFNSIHVWLEVLHILSVISWMAGIMYLPRLYVYHTRVDVGGDQDVMFQEMERKLLRVIMNPAMIATWIFGISLALSYGLDPMLDIWFSVKLAAVIGMTAYHMFLARVRKTFAAGTNARSEKFFRMINEVPAVLLIIIVTMVVVQPV